jgi:hypothetical protein
MGQLREFLANDHIQIALGTGACIIIISLVFKKILMVKPTGLEQGLHGFVILAYEYLRAKKKLDGTIWIHPWPWILIMLLVVALVILHRAIFV